MKTTFLSVSVITIALSLLATAHAQEGRRGEGSFARMDLLNAALDANKDGTIDEKEIKDASAALKKLDKNGDGKLTREELRPNMPGRERAGQLQANGQEMANRLMQFDKNGDGKLSKDELPERMQSLMDRADTDKDGFLTKDEIAKSSAAQSNSTQNRTREEHREDHDDD
jgi:Ca2+-binding EF-hand superfamily protein